MGDLLSPLLFILVMEICSKILSKAINVGLLSNFQVGGGSKGVLMISHLLSADDISSFVMLLLLINLFIFNIFYSVLRQYGD